MNKPEALQYLAQLLDTMRSFAQKAADPFGPDIFYAEDIAEQVTLERIEQCSAALDVLRQYIERKGSARTDLQFTRDDVARISAEVLNTVLEKLSIRQIVAGIAVFPIGKDVWLIDIVMQDLAAESTWPVTITVLPPTGDSR